MKGSFSGTSADEVLRFLGGTEVGADGHLKDIGKAELLHGSTELAGGYLGSELTDEGGSHSGVDTLTRLDCPDGLEDLALVGDGAEGTVHQAHDRRIHTCRSRFQPCR